MVAIALALGATALSGVAGMAAFYRSIARTFLRERVARTQELGVAAALPEE